MKADVAPDAEIFATGEELIASDKVDAVLVTSWGATHEQYVLAGTRRGQALLLREAARHHRRGREAHRRRRGGARQAPRAGRLHAPLRRRLPHAEAGGRQRDRPAADGARRAPQPDGARAVHHADGDPRHADPRDRRASAGCSTTTMSRRRSSSRAARRRAACEAQGPADRAARDGEGRPHRRRGVRQLPLRLRHPVPGRGRGGALRRCRSRWRSSCARKRGCRTRS